MPTYSYACVVCGDFSVLRPMAEAGAAMSCPDCGRATRRLFGAPALRSLDPGMRRALDAQVRSADAPGVVSSPPPRSIDRRQRRVMRQATDPRQSRLPRP